MNRAELIDSMSKETSMTKTSCDQWLTTFIDVVSKNMKKKDGVKLVGFGTFKTSKRKARVGRNPQTGEEIKIPARTVPVFSPGKELKEHIWKCK